MSRVPALLRVEALTCHRGDRCLFADLDFELAAGEALRVHGPNGSGKTTLLRAICGLTAPSGGRIEWEGRAILGGSRIDTFAFRAALCFIGHANGVKAELSALENLRVWRATCAAPSAIDLDGALAAVDLLGVADVPAVALSAGQRRRIALARLLVARARLWILDEPFTSLDRAGIDFVETQVAEHVGSGGAILFTSHQPTRLSVPVGTLALAA